MGAHSKKRPPKTPTSGIVIGDNKRHLSARTRLRLILTVWVVAVVIIVGGIIYAVYALAHHDKAKSTTHTNDGLTLQQERQKAEEYKQLNTENVSGGQVYTVH